MAVGLVFLWQSLKMAMQMWKVNTERRTKCKLTHKFSFSFKNKQAMRFFKKYWIGISVITIVVELTTGPRIIDGLTPVEQLTQKYHERSKHKFRIGATCRDGWHSDATGQGACSHHG